MHDSIGGRELTGPEAEEDRELVETVGRTFSLRAVLALLATTAGVSGFGGAATVAAQDAVQDAKLEEHSRALMELRAQVADVTRAATKIGTTVEGLDEDVDEIKDDTKEIQRLLNQIIGRNGRGADR